MPNPDVAPSSTRSQALSPLCLPPPLRVQVPMDKSRHMLTYYISQLHIPVTKYLRQANYGEKVYSAHSLGGSCSRTEGLISASFWWTVDGNDGSASGSKCHISSQKAERERSMAPPTSTTLETTSVIYGTLRDTTHVQIRALPTHSSIHLLTHSSIPSGF